jgi:hypothetical protein
MLNYLSIKDQSSFSVSHIAYRRVTTNYSFMSDIIYIYLFVFFNLGSNDSFKTTSGNDTTLYSGGLRFKSQPEHSLN